MGNDKSLPTTHPSYEAGSPPAGLTSQSDEWKDATALIVCVDGAKNLPALDVVNRSSDPFFRIEAVDEPLGPQTQRTSVVCVCLNPQWIPGEVLVFYFKNPETASLAIKVLDWDRFGGDDMAGYVDLPVKSYLNAKGEHVNLRLLHPRHETQSPCTIQLRVAACKGVEAMAVHSDVVFEFERWWAGSGWGQRKMPGDPGIFCSHDCKIFGDNFADVAPPAPETWVVTHSWGIYSTPEDPNGWQYAHDTKSKAWYPAGSTATVVRRRRWRRICVDTSVVQAEIMEWMA